MPHKRTRGRKRQMAAIVEEVRPAVEAGRRSTSATSRPRSSSPSSPEARGRGEARRRDRRRRRVTRRPGGLAAWPTSSAGEGRDRLPERTTWRTCPRPVTELPGVGPRIEAALGDLGVASLADMVSALPLAPRGPLERQEDLRAARRREGYGRRTRRQHRRSGRPVRAGPGFSAQLYDGTGYIPVTVWGRSWLLNQLLPGGAVVVSGEVQSRYGIQLAAKSIEVIDDLDGDDGPHAGRFVPVYPVNKGIQARRMRTLIHRALDAAGRILDPLPAEVLVRHDLPNLHDAIHEVHFPTERARLAAAMRRLIFHELFLIQTGLAARKARLEDRGGDAATRGDGSLLNPFLKGLPFGLPAPRSG